MRLLPFRLAPPRDRQSTPTRILVADDHAIVRSGLKAILTSRTHWTVCGEATCGAEALALANQLRPDVIVMDLNMPGLMTGLDALRAIKDRLPDTGIVILTLYSSSGLINEVVKAGARGYVSKSDANRDLVNAVSAVAAGKTYFTPEAHEFDASPEAPRAISEAVPASGLSSPEREAVRTLAQTMRKLL